MNAGPIPLGTMTRHGTMILSNAQLPSGATEPKATATHTDVISNKLDHTFTSMDANQNGYLERADYESHANRYLQAYKLDRNDRRARAIIAFYQLYWLELLRHAGVDGDRLTKDQFIAAQRLAGIDTSRLNMVEGSSHAVFDCIDDDGDNEISKAEFERLLRDVWKVTAPEARETSARLDTDGDGAISRQEFIRSQREYFLSSDADAPGSLFFGPI
ncbi:hypothetical protein GCM10009647_085270 [Streptomyces sanglieri]